MKIPKKYPIQIWLLDDDLRKSAEYLSNKRLSSSIVGCVRAMVCTRLYFCGIRRLKIYKYYFDDVRLTETLEKHFPNWALNKPPTFKGYNSQESKWTRKCKEHYDFITRYLEILLDEYVIRFHRENPLSEFLSWDMSVPFKIPSAHLKKLTYCWKNLNPRNRRKNVIQGYRIQYSKLIGDPFIEYSASPRGIPEWLMGVC